MQHSTRESIQQYFVQETYIIIASPCCGVENFIQVEIFSNYCTYDFPRVKAEMIKIHIEF